MPSPYEIEEANTTVTMTMLSADLFGYRLRAAYAGDDWLRLTWVGSQFLVWLQQNPNPTRDDCQKTLFKLDQDYSSQARGEPEWWVQQEIGREIVFSGLEAIPVVGKAVRWPFMSAWTALQPLIERRKTEYSQEALSDLREQAAKGGDAISNALIEQSLKHPEVALALDTWGGAKLHDKGISWTSTQNWSFLELGPPSWAPDCVQNAAAKNPGKTDLHVDFSELKNYLGEQLGRLEEKYFKPSLELLHTVDAKIDIMASVIGKIRDDVHAIAAKEDIAIAWMAKQNERQAEAQRQQTQQALMQEELHAASSAIYFVSRLLEGVDPQLSKQVASLGSFAITVASSTYEFARTVSMLGDVGGALGSVVLTGNLGAALTSFVNVMLDVPSTDQVILEQLGKIQEQIGQLRSEMHERFDWIDRTLTRVLAGLDQIMTELGHVEARLDYIQERLNGLTTEVRHVASNLNRYLTAERFRDIAGLQDSVLQYEERLGQTLPFLDKGPDYEEAERELYAYATGNAAFDVIANGGFARMTDDHALASELSPANLSLWQNVNYLADVLRERDWPTFKSDNETLVNAELWGVAASSLALLNIRHPAYALRTPELARRRAEIVAVGQRLGDALSSIWLTSWEDPKGPKVNTELILCLVSYYLSKFNVLLECVDAAWCDYLGDNGLTDGFFFYSDKAWQAYAAPPTYDEGGRGPLESPSNLMDRIPETFRLAWLALNPHPEIKPVLKIWGAYYEYLELAVSAKFQDRVVPIVMLRIPLQSFKDAPYLEHKPGGWAVDWNRVYDEYIVPNWSAGECFRQLFESANAEVYPWASWDGCWDWESEAWAWHFGHDAKSNHLRRIFEKVAGDGQVQESAGQLDGATALIRSLLQLGLPGGLENDNLLHSLIYGTGRLLDGSLALEYLTSDVAKEQTLRPRFILHDAGQRRIDALARCEFPVEGGQPQVESGALLVLLNTYANQRIRELPSAIISPMSLLKIQDGLLAFWENFDMVSMLPTLRRGDHGDSVRRFTALLQAALAPAMPVTITDSFNDDTAAALAEFQVRYGLKQEDVVGPYVWAALLGVMDYQDLHPAKARIELAACNGHFCSEGIAAVTNPKSFGDWVLDIMGWPEFSAAAGEPDGILILPVRLITENNGVVEASATNDEELCASWRAGGTCAGTGDLQIRTIFNLYISLKPALIGSTRNWQHMSGRDLLISLPDMFQAKIKASIGFVGVRPSDSHLVASAMHMDAATDFVVQIKSWMVPIENGPFFARARVVLRAGGAWLQSSSDLIATAALPLEGEVLTIATLDGQPLRQGSRVSLSTQDGRFFSEEDGTLRFGVRAVGATPPFFFFDSREAEAIGGFPDGTRFALRTPKGKYVGLGTGESHVLVAATTQEATPSETFTAYRPR